MQTARKQHSLEGKNRSRRPWVRVLLTIGNGNQANWRAGHCAFIVYPMVKMTRNEIYEMKHILKGSTGIRTLTFATDWKQRSIDLIKPTEKQLQIPCCPVG